MKKNVKMIILLHILLAVYSLSGIFGKRAACYEVMSSGFVLCYASLICILGIYAVFWQQIIRYLPLTVAYSNKAVTIIWGIIWGKVFFNESVSLCKVAGAIIVAFGVVMYTFSNPERENMSQ